MTPWCKAAVVCAGGALSCAPAAHVPVESPPLPSRRALSPLTRAERSSYTETSRYADVRTFLDSLRALGAPLVFGVLGRTSEGREIPYVIAARPLARTPEEARRIGRPVVYVQGNIHAGEVDGKEALQMLVRDLVFEQKPNVLDSIVLIAVPIYNADGNEDVGPQEHNRPEQNGPAIVGKGTNAMGLNLNRDYMKAEAPETRASLAMFNAWDPDVFVDLHTTDGSLHGYALTYAPTMNPAAPLEGYTRAWLYVLRQRMRERHGFETFDYGNFGTDETPWHERVVYSPRVHAWTSFDSRPRFSTNYYGLRNGFAILSESYSHDPFERRIASTYAFVREILSLAAENHRQASRAQLVSGYFRGQLIPRIPIRTRLSNLGSRPGIGTAPVLVEDVEVVADSVRTEPGLRPGLRRTGHFRSVAMPVYDRFQPVKHALVPFAYGIPERMANVVENLRLHGIVVDRVGQSPLGTTESFVIDSIARASQAFEGHRETRIAGRWQKSAITLQPQDWIVLTRQRLGNLAAYLLEPESDDGLVNWNYFDAYLNVGSRYPVVRVHRSVP